MPDILPTINNEPPQGIQALLDTVYLWNPDVANDLIEKVNELLARLQTISGAILPYEDLSAPVEQYTPCFYEDGLYVAATDLEELPAEFDEQQWILIATNGGSTGTMDYNDLENKPGIGGVTLTSSTTKSDIEVSGVLFRTWGANE